jgi:hypothetical protein
MSQVNLSGFAAGADNVYQGGRLQGEERAVALSLLKAQKESRDERLKVYFADRISEIKTRNPE